MRYVWALIQWYFTIIVILIKVRSDYRALIYRCMIHVDCTYYDCMIYLQFLIFAKTVFFSQINLIKGLWLKSEKITLEPRLPKMTYGNFHFIVTGSIYVDCIRHFVEDSPHMVTLHTSTVDEQTKPTSLFRLQFVDLWFPTVWSAQRARALKKFRSSDLSRIWIIHESREYY